MNGFPVRFIFTKALLLAAASSLFAALESTPLALDEPVRSIALQPDGRILIAGEFTTVQGAVRGHVARLNPDGTTDFTFMNGLAGANAPIYSSALQSDGKILVGGLFGFVNGVQRRGLARLNPDGSLDMSFNSLTGSAPFVLQSDGKVVAATARLTNTGTRDNVFRLNPDGTRDTNWAVLLNGGVSLAMAQQPDGRMVMVGNFASVNGSIRDGISRVNTDSTTDGTFENGMTGVPGDVRSLALQSDGKVLIGGYFFFVNGTSRTRIARLNPNGSLDTGFQNGMAGADGDVEAIVLQPDGKVLIGGAFRSVNATPRSGVARLNQDGSLDSSFQNGMTGTDGIVFSIGLQPDGKVLIGGGFTAVNGVTRYRIGRMNADGSTDPGFHNGGPPPPVIVNAQVRSNRFGFQVRGESNEVFVIEASTNFLQWMPLATNRFTGSALPFDDPASTRMPSRFYRARLP